MGVANLVILSYCHFKQKREILSVHGKQDI